MDPPVQTSPLPSDLSWFVAPPFSQSPKFPLLHLNFLLHPKIEFPQFLLGRGKITPGGWLQLCPSLLRMNPALKQPDVPAHPCVCGQPKNMNQGPQCAS